MKIMICQPMNGREEKQIRKERAELVKELEDQGHNVIDTVFTEEQLTLNRPANCNAGLWALAKSLEILSQVDALVCMKGWENARGCKIEEYCARKYGKYVMYL